MTKEKTFSEFVEGLTDKALHCRELGHTWRPFTVQWDGEARCYDRRLRCHNCRTMRVQLLTQSGHVMANRYIYPEGYLAKGFSVRAEGRDVLRLASVVRFLEAHPIEGAA